MNQSFVLNVASGTIAGVLAALIVPILQQNNPINITLLSGLVAIALLLIVVHIAYPKVIPALLNKMQQFRPLRPLLVIGAFIATFLFMLLGMPQIAQQTVTTPTAVVIQPSLTSNTPQSPITSTTSTTPTIVSNTPQSAATSTIYATPTVIGSTLRLARHWDAILVCTASPFSLTQLSVFIGQDEVYPLSQAFLPNKLAGNQACVCLAKSDKSVLAPPDCKSLPTAIVSGGDWRNLNISIRQGQVPLLECRARPMERESYECNP